MNFRKNNKLQRGLGLIWKYTLILLLAMYVVLVMPISKTLATSDQEQDKKAIILILDEVSLEEIFISNTPNIDLLMENGSMGFINTRSRSSRSNRGSAYLSLGMGVRSLASSQGGVALERNEIYPLSDYDLMQETAKAEDLYKLYTGNNPPKGEIINIAIGNIEKTALETTPNNRVGLFGKVAREKGLVIGALGNSDYNKPAREFTMMGMDENGIIPLGSIDSQLLSYDPNILGGIKLDQEILLEKFEEFLPKVDILFIDYGDTVRIEKTDKITSDKMQKEQKQKAIERGDAFLGEVMKKIDLENTLLAIISPNPPVEEVRKGNFALTPIILSGDNIGKGLLTSSTTRREGLVTNFDFAPTILDYFQVSKSNEFIGEPVKSLKSENPREILLENQKQNLYLRKYRKFFHRSFIILLGMALIGFYLPRFTRWKGPNNRIMKHLGLTLLGIPLTMMTISLFGYKSIVFDLIYVLGGAFLIAYVLNKIFSNDFMSMSILGIITSGLIIIDVLFLDKLMIISPLGSDAIAGGRFYGIGNDYMGVLLGSTILGIFSFLNIYKMKKITMSIIITSYMFIVILGLSPFFGANIGGTLSAMIITLLILYLIFDKKISFKTIISAFLLVILGGVLLGVLDTLFNPNPTHGGKAIESLISGGLGKFIEIINSKLRQVFWNLANSSWNIILFAQMALMILLYKLESERLKEIRQEYPILFKGFIGTLLGSLIIFVLNDTGTIAAALFLIYLFVPLGILMNDE